LISFSNPLFMYRNRELRATIRMQQASSAVQSFSGTFRTTGSRRALSRSTVRLSQYMQAPPLSCCTSWYRVLFRLSKARVARTLIPSNSAASRELIPQLGGLV
jgi:hypothetical protein